MAIQPSAAQNRAGRSASEEQAQLGVPDGYLRLNGVKEEIWSQTARDTLDTLMFECDARNPDLNDCYIYNDFYPYATLDLLETELSKFAKGFKKAPTSKKTWEILEGLTLWMCMEQAYYMVDDGECFQSCLSVFASAWHTLASTLHLASPNSLLTEDHIPNVGNVLKTAVSLLEGMDTSTDVSEGTVTSLRVLLCLEGLGLEKKADTILGGAGDEEDEDDEEQQPPKKKSKKERSEEEEIKELTELGFKEAEKELGHKVTQYRFSTLHNKYKAEYGKRVEMKFGKGYNIQKWPASLRNSVKFDGEGGGGFGFGGGSDEDDGFF